MLGVTRSLKSNGTHSSVIWSVEEEEGGGLQRRPENSIQTWQNVIIWSGFALGLYANMA